jgi:hypothetical protein
MRRFAVEGGGRRSGSGYDKDDFERQLVAVPLIRVDAVRLRTPAPPARSLTRPQCAAEQLASHS